MALNQSLNAIDGKQPGKVKQRNKAYYLKYPEDIMRVKNIIKYIETEAVFLSGGGRLSTLRLRQLGMSFGFHGNLDTVHGMCELQAKLFHG